MKCYKKIQETYRSRYFLRRLRKIIKSKISTKEIDNVISFNPTEFDQNEDKSNSAIKSVQAVYSLKEDEDTRTTNGSILIVDDNKQYYWFQKRLQKIGNKVEVANDGLEALKAAKKSNWD